MSNDNKEGVINGSDEFDNGIGYNDVVVINDNDSNNVMGSDSNDSNDVNTNDQILNSINILSKSNSNNTNELEDLLIYKQR